MAESKQDINVIEKEVTVIKDSSIIKRFEGAKSKRGTQVHCPAFWELKWANGCHYDCQWCFLNGTYRFLDRGKEPNLKTISVTLTHIRDALEKIKTPTVFNAGELSDGFVFPEPMVEQILPLFTSELTNPHGHKILLLTKSKSLAAKHLPPNNIIIGHSLNCKYVARTYELRAPHPWDRIEASRAYSENGFETRFRIDPMVPVNAWHVGYRELVERVVERNPHVDVITLGSLRGLQSTINMCKKLKKDTSWLKYIEGGESTNFGKRASVELRTQMYGLIKDVLKENGYKGHLALCKETAEVWKAIGLKPAQTKCNCLI